MKLNLEDYTKVNLYRAFQQSVESEVRSPETNVRKTNNQQPKTNNQFNSIYSNFEELEQATSTKNGER